MINWTIEHNRGIWRVMTLLGGVALLVSTVILAVRWPGLPSRVPTHYDLFGNADGYGGKSSLWLLPLINLGCFVLITFCALHPTSWNTGVKLTPKNREAVLALGRVLLGVTQFFTTLGLAYMSCVQAFCHPLGVWFMPVFLAAVIAPSLLYYVAVQSVK